MIRSGAREQEIEALQVSVRWPKYPGVGWATNLIEEAHDMSERRAFRSAGNRHFANWIGVYQAFVRAPTLPVSPQAPQFRTLGAPAYAWILCNAGGEKAVERERHPYHHAEGFWTALAIVLPAWRNYFSRTSAEVDELLEAFDATYNDPLWQAGMTDLSKSELFRFSLTVMAAIRGRIAALP